MTVLDLNAERFFPDEIMFEILTRLTAEVLLRCKCVCKRWNEIIKHPKFIEMQMLRGEKWTLYYTSKDGTADTFTILHCRYGLLVEKIKISGMYRVRNPITKQILALPDPQEDVMFMRIFFLPITRSFKLVSFFNSKNEIGKLGGKVLSLGDSDLSWRALEDCYFHDLDTRRQKFLFSLNNSFLYCIGLSIDGSNNSQILCLDVENEIFTGSSPLSMPKTFFLNWKKVQPMKWDEKLALGTIVEEELHVLVLENVIQQKWAEKKIIVPLTFLKENPDMKETLDPFFASIEIISFTQGNVHAIVHYIRSKKILRSQSMPPGPPGKIVSHCVASSLVTLKGMQPENEEQTDEVA